MNQNMKIVISAIDAKGKVIVDREGNPIMQDYDDYLCNDRNPYISLFLNGKPLFYILLNDLGCITFNKNKEKFQFLFAMDDNNTIRLLGRIAEAVLVRECQQNKEANRIWFMYARRGKKVDSVADNYKAIGTGLKTTQNSYKTKYNPQDTQRDIIWINPETGSVSQMLYTLSSGNSAIYAGLQVKVSTNGNSYIQKDLMNRTYEVPLVYFDMNNDFHKIVRRLQEHNSNIKIGIDFIDGKAISQNIYNELKSYMPLIKWVLSGRFSVDELFYEAIEYKDNTLKSALMSSALSYGQESCIFTL